MSVMVALLRAVNVGGTGTLAMADLRAVATDLGYDDVATYLQSGNLVLSSADDPSVVATTLTEAIAQATSAAPAVIVRTADHLVALVAANPFLARGEDQARLHIAFADGPATSALPDKDLATYAPEEAVAMGSDLFLFLPAGVGRSPLTRALGRRGGVPVTVRSWRTVTALVELTEQAGA